MDLRLYNTLTRKKDKLIPLKSGSVGLYTCGPTVYNYAHIGNLRTYIFEDVLKRTLLFNNLKVKHVMNITDVGHLTSDADSGEDKMLKGARREKKTVWEVAKFYTDAFKSDIKKLNIIPPDIWCKATDHIPDQIKMIQSLEKKGFTYQAGGNVYFDTSKVKDYGKLARLNLSEEKKARVKKDPNKKNSHDFVLWFTKSKFQDQEMKWNSPWGHGYPGWHIECSAMSTKYLGEQFDMHCGGIDHVQIHHTNEIAQTESATGKKPWVKFWLHSGFLVLGGGKRMGKSKGNFLTLSVIEKKGFDPLDYRFLVLGTHYHKPLVFSLDALNAAKIARFKLNSHILEIKTARRKLSSPESKAVLADFTSYINSDLNTPKAIALAWEVFRNDKLSDSEKYALLLEFDKVFGLSLNNLKKNKIPSEIKKLAEKRETARKNKAWDIADKVRAELKKRGFIIEDTPEGPKVKAV